MTPIERMFFALATGQYDEFRSIVASGADVYAFDFLGDSIATACAKFGRRATEALRTIASTTGSIDIPDQSGETALAHAVASDEHEMVRILLSLGASVKYEKLERPILHYAAFHSGVSTVCELLRAAARDDLEKCDMRKTPLMVALDRHHKRIASEFIQACVATGADLNAVCGTGDMAAAHHAAYWGDLEIVKILLDLGVDFDKQSDAGTAREIAVREHGDGAAVRRLLRV